jgi:hypothetical protein
MYSQCNLLLIKKLFLDLAKFSGGVSKILYSLASAPGTTISFGSLAQLCVLVYFFKLIIGVFAVKLSSGFLIYLVDNSFPVSLTRTRNSESCKYSRKVLLSFITPLKASRALFVEIVVKKVQKLC